MALPLNAEGSLERRPLAEELANAETENRNETQPQQYVHTQTSDIAMITHRLEKKLERPWYVRKKMWQCRKVNPNCVSYDDYCSSFKVYKKAPTAHYPAMDPIDKIVHLNYKYYLKSSKVRKIILLAGPPGSGKTTVLQSLDRLDPATAQQLKNGTAIFVDRTMGTGEEGRVFVQKALDHNKDILYIHVMRHFLTAVPSMLLRAKASGRCTTSRNFANLALGSLCNTNDVIDRFSTRIRIVVADNASEHNDMRLIEDLDVVKERLNKYRKDITDHPDIADPHEAVYANVKKLNHLRYDQGDIPHSVIEGTSGREGLRNFLHRNNLASQAPENE